MDKNKKILIGSIIAGLLIVAACVVIILKPNTDNSGNTSGTGSSSSVIEQAPLEEVEDVRDKVTAENFTQALGDCQQLNDIFNITEGKANSFLRLGHNQFRILDRTEYKGERIGEGFEDTFTASVTPGINNTPDVGLGFYAVDLVEEDVEEMAKEILTSVASEELANRVMSLEYNTTDVVKAKTEDENPDISIQKMKSEYTDSEGKTTASYSFGISYAAYSAEPDTEYKFRDYDKKLFMGIPIFKKSGFVDVGNSLSAMELCFLIGAKDADIMAYSSEVIGNMHKSAISVNSIMESGETVTSAFRCEYDEDTKLMDYTFDTMTGYNETKEAALEDAIKQFNGITDLKLTTTDLTGEDGEYIYFDADISYMLSISIKEEQGLGFYAIITSM